MRRLRREVRQVGHAGESVDLEHERSVVVGNDEVDPRISAAAERPVGAERGLLDQLGQRLREPGRQDELGPAFGILRFEIIELGFRNEFEDGKSGVAENADGHVLPFNEFFDENAFELVERRFQYPFEVVPRFHD